MLFLDFRKTIYSEIVKICLAEKSTKWINYDEYVWIFERSVTKQRKFRHTLSQAADTYAITNSLYATGGIPKGLTEVNLIRL